jgi:hypothetical protein
LKKLGPSGHFVFLSVMSLFQSGCLSTLVRDCQDQSPDDTLECNLHEGQLCHRRRDLKISEYILGDNFIYKESGSSSR